MTVERRSSVGREDAHTSGLYTKRPLVIVRGEGAPLYDEDSREYIDCVGGQGSANLGHVSVAVADAIAAQARTLASCTEPENAGPAIKVLQDEGILALGAGPTVVRYLPPLVISAAQIDPVLAATAKVLA